MLFRLLSGLASVSLFFSIQASAMEMDCNASNCDRGCIEGCYDTLTEGIYRSSSFSCEQSVQRVVEDGAMTSVMLSTVPSNVLCWLFDSERPLTMNCAEGTCSADNGQKTLEVVSSSIFYYDNGSVSGVFELEEESEY